MATFDTNRFLASLPEQEAMAIEIVTKWDYWKSIREKKDTEWQELSQYIFAVDTTQTTNSQLPWKNKTTKPKLTQIRDNLHANIMALLFSSDKWLSWEGDKEDDDSLEVRSKIETFMRSHLGKMKFQSIISQLVYDWIDYGNAFSDIDTVRIVKKRFDGTDQVLYEGPVPVRISPYDIVFDPTAKSFEDSPKIVRKLVSVGQLVQDVKNNPGDGWKQEAIDKVTQDRQNFFKNRSSFTSHRSEANKNAGTYSVHGFGTLEDYYGSGMVELLEFDGTLFDPQTGELYENRLITVVDRRYVVRNIQHPSVIGKSYKQHVGWRLRPDNLWAMGPLDNLVGMQYRIDHLENLKADVFDLIAHPVVFRRGDVEFDGWFPGAEAVGDTDSDVKVLVPDSQALSADLQIAEYENQMEELAGAPRNAMGIRTPGEKTKFEVQQLQSAVNRVFQNKTTYFEEVFLEPLINNMFSILLNDFSEEQEVRTLDPALGTPVFETVTKDDLNKSGKLYPRGARQFVNKANMLQDLVQLYGSVIGQDPAVKVHLSGKSIARLVEQLLDLEQYNIYGENISLAEQAETQSIMLELQAQVQAQADPALTEEAEQSEDVGQVDEQQVQ